MNQPTTEQIRIWTKQIAESNRKAFECFFRLMYPRLVRFACRYTNSKSSACDIVQDAFVVLWENRNEVDPQRSLKAYLYTTVRNRSLNYIRDHSDKKVRLNQLSESQIDIAESDSQSESYKEFIDRLKNWIDELPDRQREAFKLSRFEGLDHDEISLVMDISPNTVNNHIVAALQNLKDRHETYTNDATQNQIS